MMKNNDNNEESRPQEAPITTLYQIMGIDRLQLVEWRNSDGAAGYDADSSSSSDEGDSYANDSAVVAMNRRSFSHRQIPRRSEGSRVQISSTDNDADDDDDDDDDESITSDLSSMAEEDSDDADSYQLQEFEESFGFLQLLPDATVVRNDRTNSQRDRTQNFAYSDSRLLWLKAAQRSFSCDEALASPQEPEPPKKGAVAA